MMCFCDWLLVTNYLKNSLLCVYTTLFHPLSYELSLEPFLGYLNYISVLSSLTKIKILFFFKKKKKKGQVQELDWTQVKIQPMSKERLWETFRNPGERFIKTPLEAKFKEMIHGCAFSLTQQLRHSALTASDGKRSCKSTLLECTIGDVCACARVHVYMLIIICPNGRWCNGVSPPTSYSSHLLSTFFIQHAQLCGHLDEMARSSQTCGSGHIGSPLQLLSQSMCFIFLFPPFLTFCPSSLSDRCVCRALSPCTLQRLLLWVNYIAF